MSPLVLPPQQLLDWAECEIGVIIHLDLQVFEPSYENFRKCWGYTPSASVFNPSALDTDQWLETAKDAGAAYAVLVAKHCSGFCLWPTDAHDFSVKSSPWRNGQGDIVRDFIASCKKYGLRPGIYCSSSINARYQVDNPGKVRSGCAQEQAAYNQIVEQQAQELWSRYGDLFEIWFDGGVLRPEDGGPALLPLLHQYQPNAVVFQGPAEWPLLLRHVGNERACTPEPFWSTTDVLTSTDGTAECEGLGGSPDASRWAPGEADMPNRLAAHAFQSGWFWRAGEEKYLYSLKQMIDCYFTSVGRNTNQLIGMVIDNRGLVPDADRQRFREFGSALKTLYANPAGCTGGTGSEFLLQVNACAATDMLCIMEDIRFGERVRAFVVEGKLDGQWLTVWRGTNIGHRHLERLRGRPYEEFRLRITASVGEPRIRNFSAWQAGSTTVPFMQEPAERCSIAINRDRDGNVSFRCDNPYLDIHYTTDGTAPDRQSTPYTSPFAMPEGGTVKACASYNSLTTSAVESATFGCCRKQWRVVRTSYDSPYANGGKAGVAHLLDDDSSTYWHTYDSDEAKSRPPHEVVLQMDCVHRVAAFTLLPFQTGRFAPEEYEFFLSNDGIVWRLAAEGTLDYPQTKHGMRVIPLDQPLEARYIRFVCKRVVEDGHFLMLAGFGIIDSATMYAT